MTQIQLKELVEYKNNSLYWIKTTSNRVKIGTEIGSIQPNGYRGVRLFNKYYGLHVLIYIYHYGDIPLNMFVDHIDRNKLNNAITNLRLVSKQENTFNCTNTKGYIIHKNKFIARITLNKKQYQIGTYATAEEATEAYETIKPLLHVFSQKHPTEQEIRKKINELRPTLFLNNTSGYKGVHKRYNGTFQAKYGDKSIGHYLTAELANNARLNYINNLTTN